MFQNFAFATVASSLLHEALFVVLSALGATLVASAIKVVDSYRKAHMDSRATDVICESISVALVDIVQKEVIPSLRDGKISPAELDRIKMAAKNVAVPRLQRLSGFFKTDIVSWVEVKIDAYVVKIIRDFLGDTVDVVSPDDTAVDANDTAVNVDDTAVEEDESRSNNSGS